MSFIVRRQLSTLIPPKIASVKVCLFRKQERNIVVPSSDFSTISIVCFKRKTSNQTNELHEVYGIY